MADTELASLTEDTFVESGDWFYKVDSGGTTDSKVNRDNTRGYSIIRKSADESVTSSTTMQADNHLTWSVGSGETYVGEFVLYVTGATSGDIKVGLLVPTGTGYFDATGLATSAASSETSMRNLAISTLDGSANIGVGLVAGGAINKIECKFSVVTAASGSITLYWAQDVSDGTATTIKAGSFVKYHRIA